MPRRRGLRWRPIGPRGRRQHSGIRILAPNKTILQERETRRVIDSGPEIMAPNDESRAGDGVFVEHRGNTHTQSFRHTVFTLAQESFPFLIFLSALIFLCMEESFRIVGDGVISSRALV
jgi:hypothetical protein